VSHRLDGVREKVDWAQRHYDSLSDEIHTWVNRHMHSGGRDFYPEAGVHVIRWEAPATPPLWSVMCGNIVHNLRSALDHLVWQMVLAHGVQPPKEGFGGNSFPIGLKEPGKGETFGSIYVGNGKLAGVHPDHIALIEECQPYKLIPQGVPAREHRLAILDELWQIDKHRHLHFTTFVLPPAPKMEMQFEVSDESSILDSYVFDVPPRRLKQGEVLAWFRAVGPRRPQPQVHVNLDLPAQPAIYELGPLGGPPGYEGAVSMGKTLQRIGDYVATIINRAAAIPPL
jgi:hypothetical protein